MFICTTLPSYGFSIVLSSLLLLFRKHNIIFFTAAPPPIDASTWADMIGGGRWLWCGGEGTCLVTRARACAQDAQPSESAAKDPTNNECFDDGGAYATSPFVPVWPESTQQLNGGCTAARLLASPTTSNSASTSFHSSKQQVDVTLKAHIVSLCFKCFRCFIDILQVFLYGCCRSRPRRCICYNCCTRMLSAFVLMFHLFFRIILCCKYVIRMLHTFHVYVASVLSGCYVCLCNGFKYFFKCFCKYFRYMFQVFHLPYIWIF
jgi:hypothetical protein